MPGEHIENRTLDEIAPGDGAQHVRCLLPEDKKIGQSSIEVPEVSVAHRRRYREQLDAGSDIAPSVSAAAENSADSLAAVAPPGVLPRQPVPAFILKITNAMNAMHGPARHLNVLRRIGTGNARPRH